MIHSFLLIGQSNMAGRGFLDEAAPLEKEHIRVLRNGRWQPLYRPVNCDRPFSGSSLAESFAQSYARDHQVTVGLIPCADGGTSLNQWREGSLLFDHAVYQARLAQRTSTIAGVLWHQGESDCFIDLAKTYKDRFSVIMDAFRKELDLYDVPFILGGLGDFLANHTLFLDTENYDYKLVNKQLKEIADTTPMVGFVSAEGLTSKEDNLHFNTEALYEFGLRYFDEFEKRRDPNKVFEEKSDMDSAIRTAMELL